LDFQEDPQVMMAKKSALSFLPILLFVGFILGRPAVTIAESLETIETRPGVTVSFLVNEAVGKPRAAAVLFTGGTGKLKLWKGGRTKSKNFLARTRTLFAAQGILTLIVDVPSDRRRKGLVNFRDTAAHRADITGVIDWLRQNTTVPVWLIGTSRGTISLAHLGAVPNVDGLVFTATVTGESDRRPATVFDANLGAIRVPVLLAHHSEDACRITLAEDLPFLAEKLTKARKVETILFKGGRTPESDDCRSLSRHGFYGIEAQVVKTITDWIKNQPNSW
jgi:dienelactone hydrolase